MIEIDIYVYSIVSSFYIYGLFVNIVIKCDLYQIDNITYNNTCILRKNYHLFLLLVNSKMAKNSLIISIYIINAAIA